MCLKVHPTEANDEDLNDIQYEFKHFLPRVKGAFLLHRIHKKIWRCNYVNSD